MMDEEQSGGRVLVIEDDEEIVDVLRRTLRAEGYEVRVSEEGAGGVRVSSEFLPDLVILDLGLPDMDGLEVCSLLREENSELPILMLTARDGAENRVAGLDSGADDYLEKPYNRDELLARMPQAKKNPA